VTAVAVKGHPSPSRTPFSPKHWTRPMSFEGTSDPWAFVRDHLAPEATVDHCERRAVLPAKPMTLPALLGDVNLSFGASS